MYDIFALAIVFSYILQIALLCSFKRRPRCPLGFQIVTKRRTLIPSRTTHQKIFGRNSSTLQKLIERIEKSTLFKVKKVAAALHEKKKSRIPESCRLHEKVFCLTIFPEIPLSIGGIATYHINNADQPVLGIESQLLNMPIILRSSASHELFHFAQEQRANYLTREIAIQNTLNILTAQSRLLAHSLLETPKIGKLKSYLSTQTKLAIKRAELGVLGAKAEVVASIVGSPLISTLSLTPIGAAIEILASDNLFL